jgi:perosamine synthetase
VALTKITRAGHSASSHRISWWEPDLDAAEEEHVIEVLRSKYLNDGDVTSEFERHIAAIVGARNAVATTSGTTAIFLALAASGIGHGDEVIVPDVTFIATANAVTLTGATPVLVDVDPGTLMLDPVALERAITPRTKAVVPVHVSGRAAAIERIMEIANPQGIAVVEDAAEAFCSRHHGRCLGTFGVAGCFSFSPNKTITTGQGGLVVTADDALAVRLRELKDQGRPVRGTGGNDVHAVIGYNFKLTNLQAAVGLGQLAKLAARMVRLRDIYRWYVAGLADVPQIRLLEFDVDHGESPQWIDALADDRDGLVAHLLRHDMHCRPFWFPLHTQQPYRRAGRDFPNSSRLMPNAVWLPSAFQLGERDVRLVCDEIRRYYSR